MLLGPIFHAELLRTARRKRYYAIRLLYGMLLLFVIWASYEGMVRGRKTLTIDQAARFALDTFVAFAVVQLIAILLMIPALFGGAIADEKQRKTLHYLMASQLSSFEIVVDKVLGRAPHLAVFLAMGLPVVCLLGLVGGVPPEYVAVAYLGTASTASMAVALTVLVSTLARKVRQAVLIAYIVLLGWQFAPMIVFSVGWSAVFPATYPWIEPVNRWVGATTPLWVWVATFTRTAGMGGLTSWVAEQVAWMVGLQFGASALMLALAVWQLRPAFRRHEATQPRRKWFGEKKAKRVRASRWYDRPGCGLDAMGWKERYFARTDVLTKLVVLPSTVVVTVFLVLYVGIDETLMRAVADLWSRGIRGWGSGGDGLVEHLRVFSAWYVAIWLLAVAGASASSVAVEREEDTWVSLTSTPLTGWEILRGKALGAIWAQRGFGLVPLTLWTIGLLTGSLHPLGFLGAVLALGLTTWMVAAVGVHASLRATSTSKALAATIARLFVLYGYLYLGYQATFNHWQWDWYYVTVLGLPPRLVVAPLVSYGWVSRGGQPMDPNDVFDLPLALTVMGTYLLIATVLTLLTLTRFDRWLDRPALLGDLRSPRKPAPVLDELEPALRAQS